MWALAYKNLWRDRRRTISTGTAVLVGMLALLLFFSYVRFIESALARVAIYQEGNGHVQIYRVGGPENVATFPAKYSINADEQVKISQALQKVKGVRRNIPQMAGVGLIQHGQKSAIFLAVGVDPDMDKALQAGSGWSMDKSQDKLDANGILVTRQIADILNASKGSELQLAATTYENRLNAIDTDVAGFYSTGVEVIEDKSVKLPISMMQSLYATDAISRVVVELEDRSQTAVAASEIAQSLEHLMPGQFEVTTWDSRQISQVYNSFMGFFNMLFFFTGTIVLLIAITTVQHTIAMNIRDRLREIGTMRAMGFGRSSLVRLFVYESLATGILAGVTAFALAYLVFLLLKWANFMTVIPRVSQKVPLALELPLWQALSIVLIAIIMIGLSSVVTAWRKIAVTSHRAHKSSVSLSSLMNGAAAALVLGLALPLLLNDAHAAEPDETTMRAWLKKADISRGGFGSYKWKLKIHSQEPAGNTETTYEIALNAGNAVARTIEPKRLQGEKILIASRAMWYFKPGLRRPISISPQQRLIGEASNGDIASVQYSTDYKPQYLGEEVIEGRRCHKLKLVAISDHVTYESIIYYLDKQTMLALKTEFIATSGSIFKYALLKYDNRITYEGREIPFISHMKIVNASFPDRVSTLDYNDVSTANNPESIFMLNNLTSM